LLVGYARVSTRDQSPALQIEALRQAGCERVFMERASGAQRDRPELKAALDYLRAGDTLAVWKLDRLARSVRQLVETAEDLAKREIGLKVLTQAIDTTSPGGRLVFHVFAAVAEFERELTLERTHAGLAQARALGRRGGRKPAMGPAEIKRAKAMLADPTITVEEVAQQIGVQPSTLYRHIPGGRSSLSQPAQMEAVCSTAAFLSHHPTRGPVLRPGSQANRSPIARSRNALSQRRRRCSVASWTMWQR